MSYNYEIKFNETRLKDIELPKIDEYTVVNTETNEIIMENGIINSEAGT